MNPPDSAIILTEGLTKDYVLGAETVHALRDVDIRIDRGDFVAIMGHSGSGKSTLLNLIGCLDTPTSGEYWLNGTMVSQLSDDELARIRNREIGFVFQTFNLLPRATALHNVELPLIYAGIKAKARHERAVAVMEQVGLADRMKHKPTELSGGQRQRVAIARALVNHPSIVLADEPTGNLDTGNSEQVADLLWSEVERLGCILLVATHSQAIAERAHRVIELGSPVVGVGKCS